MASSILVPQDDEALTELVNAHRAFANQPLHLAVAFRSKGSSRQLRLLEVAENFGDNQVSDEHQFLTAWVAQSPEFRLRDSDDFYLVLTNPMEFQAALDQDWEQVRGLRESFSAGLAETLFVDNVGSDWLQRISGS